MYVLIQLDLHFKFATRDFKEMNINLEVLFIARKNNNNVLWGKEEQPFSPDDKVVLFT